MAVRGNGALPLSVRAADTWALLAAGHHGDGLCHDRQEIYKDMTRFWGKLFGINFALGVTTGLTMEFEFGTNWSYYSHYVGDVFGAPLAIEGLMAFFLESTFIGLFFLGWEKLSKRKHLTVTFFTALGSISPRCGFLSPTAGCRTPSARCSRPRPCAWRCRAFHRGVLQPGRPGQVRAYGRGRLCHRLDVRARHFRPGSSSRAAISPSRVAPLRSPSASASPLACRLSCSATRAATARRRAEGEARGHRGGDGRPNRRRPASPCSAFPRSAARIGTRFRFPVMGLIATRSLDKPVAGLDDLMVNTRGGIRSGMIAYGGLMKYSRGGDNRPTPRPPSTRTPRIIGYGLLLKQSHEEPRAGERRRRSRPASERTTIPKVWAVVLVVSRHGRGSASCPLFVFCDGLLAERGEKARTTIAGYLLARRIRHSRAVARLAKPAGSSRNSAASPGPSARFCRLSWRRRALTTGRPSCSRSAGFLTFYTGAAR